MKRKKKKASKELKVSRKSQRKKSLSLEAPIRKTLKVRRPSIVATSHEDPTVAGDATDRERQPTPPMLQMKSVSIETVALEGSNLQQQEIQIIDLEDPANQIEEGEILPGRSKDKEEDTDISRPWWRTTRHQDSLVATE